MSEANTQPVVEDVQTPAQPGAATDNARIDDLDAALKEFDTATTTSSPPEPKPAVAPAAADDVSKRVETLEKTLAEERFQKNIQPVLQKIRGDVPAEVFDDDELIAWMDARAKKDQRLQNAWVNRDRNPQAWDRVVEGLGRDFGKKFSPRVDERATADREAVTAAVRGASNRAPEGKAPDYAGMSNAEFREAHKRDYGYYPPV
jgi:hypothetical protein